MQTHFLQTQEETASRLRRKSRLAVLLLVIVIALAATVIYSFADDLRVLKTKLNGGVANSNPAVGAPANVLPNGFNLQMIAQGTDALENPSGVITRFGLLSTGTRTEPDENTYLALDHNPGGPTPGYDYGRRFLFQGHEVFSGDIAYITRINLDVTDPAHRITLLTPVGADGKTHFNAIDGSTWNPHTNTLLFTQEAGSLATPPPLPNGGVIEIPVDWPSTPRTLYGILERAGFEGVHPDDRGNLTPRRRHGWNRREHRSGERQRDPKGGAQPKLIHFPLRAQESNRSFQRRKTPGTASLDRRPAGKICARRRGASLWRRLLHQSTQAAHAGNFLAGAMGDRPRHRQ